MDVRLQSPFNLIIVGPSQSGKSVFVFKLFDNIEQLITPLPTRIIYCYSEYQEMFTLYPHIEFHEGLPDLNEFLGNSDSILLVLDDMMSQTNVEISNLFTKYSHHRNLSVIFLTQNLFYKDKHTRTMSLNTHYIVMLKNPRDATQIMTLARQMFPHNSKYMIEAFTDAVKRTYGYLLIDLKPTTMIELDCAQTSSRTRHP